MQTTTVENNLLGVPSLGFSAESAQQRNCSSGCIVRPCLGNAYYSQQGKIVNIMEFQIGFSSYLAQFFELDLHIWYLGSYLNMFLEKIKVFVKKYFFVSWGRFWIKIQSFAAVRDPAARFSFPPKMWRPLDKIALSRRVFGVGRASAVQILGRVTGSNFPEILSVLRAELVLQKGGSLFFCLIDT